MALTADRAHPAGGPRGLMVPMTTNPNLPAADVRDAVSLGVRGCDRQRADGRRVAVAWNIDLHKPDLTSLPDFVQAGRFQLRHRAGRERYDQRRVGLRRVERACGCRPRCSSG